MVALSRSGVGYLPIGCLERHGDHLPMGLDAIKAHGICCLLARIIGGVVFPAHFYAGIHQMGPQDLNKYTGQWGNLYTDQTAAEHLKDIIRQIRRMGVRVLVLYSGHYPQCQVAMIDAIAQELTSDPDFRVIPFAEPMATRGDHAAISETSLMLYLDRSYVDMSAIGETNYRDHGWAHDERSPEYASCSFGEAEAERIIAYLKPRIEPYLIR